MHHCGSLQMAGENGVVIGYPVSPLAHRQRLD
jgi:hypothetical protein